DTRKRAEGESPFANQGANSADAVRGLPEERGDAARAAHAERPYFIQMKGTARVSGRIGGGAIDGVGTGFFETYR
ncbi:MAG: hypothetical protein H0U13_00615, partial [Gemmatimonadaceae bacterium]|nr:hypothetical protein [Gemmatimonadaceae bacterium]